MDSPTYTFSLRSTVYVGDAIAFFNEIATSDVPPSGNPLESDYRKILSITTYYFMGYDSSKSLRILRKINNYLVPALNSTLELTFPISESGSTQLDLIQSPSRTNPIMVSIMANVSSPMTTQLITKLESIGIPTKK